MWKVPLDDLDNIGHPSGVYACLFLILLKIPHVNQIDNMPLKYISADL